MNYQLILLRHGQSLWNESNRFTGWHDVDLTEKGKSEALRSAKLLKEGGYQFDCVYTSLLTRAIRTMWIVLDEMNCLYLPVERSFRLNERHYGALEGLNKAQTAAEHGEAQVKIWRRSFDIAPPALEENDARLPHNDARYAALDPQLLPRCESLKDTIARVLPYWQDVLVPALRSGKKPLIVAHGNSLRALVKYLDNIDEREILELNIPTGVPLVYTLDSDLRPLTRRFLGDAKEVEALMNAVANQAQQH